MFLWKSKERVVFFSLVWRVLGVFCVLGEWRVVCFSRLYLKFVSAVLWLAWRSVDAWMKLIFLNGTKKRSQRIKCCCQFIFASWRTSRVNASLSAQSNKYRYTNGKIPKRLVTQLHKYFNQLTSHSRWFDQLLKYSWVGIFTVSWWDFLFFYFCSKLVDQLCVWISIVTCACVRVRVQKSGCSHILNVKEIQMVDRLRPIRIIEWHSCMWSYLEGKIHSGDCLCV